MTVICGRLIQKRSNHERGATEKMAGRCRARARWRPEQSDSISKSFMPRTGRSQCRGTARRNRQRQGRFGNGMNDRNHRFDIKLLIRENRGRLRQAGSDVHRRLDGADETPPTARLRGSVSSIGRPRGRALPAHGTFLTPFWIVRNTRPARVCGRSADPAGAGASAAGLDRFAG